MKQGIGGAAVLVLLAACQSRPVPRLINVPALQESSLGTTLSIQAQVQGWKAGEVAQADLHEKVGHVTAEGRMTVRTQTAPTNLQDPVKALLLLQRDETCDFNQLSVSDHNAKVALFQVVRLRRASASTGGRQALTSPALVPAVNRAEWSDWHDKAKSEDGGSGHSIPLVYADRDVLVKGQRSCRRSWGTWSGQQSDAIHVQLRKGWNEVVWESKTVYQRTYNSAGQEVKAVSETDFIVRGKAVKDNLPWKRNSDPLY